MIKEIGGFIGTKYHMGGYIKQAIDNMVIIPLVRTEAPILEKYGTIDLIDTEIFWEKISSTLKYNTS